MFESVGGERRESFELADRVDPQSQVTAVCPAPLFNRPRDMRAPHQRQRKDQKEQVVLPVVQLDEAVQCAYRARRRRPPAFELTLQRDEAWRGEWLALHALEQLDKHIEIAGSCVSAVRHALDALLLWPREA